MLNAVMDSLDAIPEQYRELYTEKDGKFELTGIAGVKTPADVQRVQRALEHEKTNHNTTKEKFSVWGELDHEEVMAKLDKYPELEAASKGNLDESQIEEMVSRRVDGTLKSQTAPLNRSIAQLTKERDEYKALADERGGYITKTKVTDAVRKALTEGKVIQHAQEDALMLAERIFEIREDDGQIVTRDNVGVTPGSSPVEWLTEMQASNARPHWWGPTTGGGANPGGRGNVPGGENPWSKDNWNMTKQGVIIREKGMEIANRMAMAVGHKAAPGAMQRDAK